MIFIITAIFGATAIIPPGIITRYRQERRLTPFNDGPEHLGVYIVVGVLKRRLCKLTKHCDRHRFNCLLEAINDPLAV